MIHLSPRKSGNFSLYFGHPCVQLKFGVDNSERKKIETDKEKQPSQTFNWTDKTCCEIFNKECQSSLTLVLLTTHLHNQVQVYLLGFRCRHFSKFWSMRCEQIHLLNFQAMYLKKNGHDLSVLLLPLLWS
jgi:hypothetical protein